MTEVRVKRRFPTSTDEKFVSFCTDVIAGLSDNPFFPEGEEHLQSLIEKFTKYKDSIPASNGKRKAYKTIKLLYKKEVIRELLSLLLYVEYKADFNMEALQSSNFELTGNCPPKDPVGEVVNVVHKESDILGELIVQCQHDPNATLYKVRVSLDGKKWANAGSDDTPTVKIYELPVGEKLHVQMQLMNSISNSSWSPTTFIELPTLEILLGFTDL